MVSDKNVGGNPWGRVDVFYPGNAQGEHHERERGKVIA